MPALKPFVPPAPAVAPAMPIPDGPTQADLPAPRMPEVAVTNPLAIPGQMGNLSMLAIFQNIVEVHINCVRLFLARRFDLTNEELGQMHFKPGPVIGSALNIEVSGFPERIITKPKGAHSIIENDFNSNFYEHLPKDLAAPIGAGHVAHVMLDETPVPDEPGKVRIGGNMRVHFDYGNPSNFFGIFAHLFGDLAYGQFHQKILHNAKPIK
jgi:hypothetical protein